MISGVAKSPSGLRAVGSACKRVQRGVSEFSVKRAACQTCCVPCVSSVSELIRVACHACQACQALILCQSCHACQTCRAPCVSNVLRAINVGRVACHACCVSIVSGGMRVACHACGCSVLVVSRVNTRVHTHTCASTEPFVSARDGQPIVSSGLASGIVCILSFQVNG